MRRMTVIALSLVFACKTKPAEDKGATPGKSGAMTSSGDMGSAMGTAVMDAPAPPAIDAAPPAKTGDEIAKRYEECLRFTSERKWDELRGCYVPTIKFEAPGLDETRTLDQEIEHHKKSVVDFPDYQATPQLVLVSGNTIISILLVTGTTNKKPIGIYLGNVVEAEPQGRFTKDLAFFDVKTLEHQLTGKPTRAIAKPMPTKIALISKGDDVERANLATFEKMMAASEDMKTFGTFIADDVVWSVQNRPKDMTKAEILAAIKQRLERTNVKFTVERTWAVGDYVASIERVSGDKVDRQVLAIHRFANGKLVHVWVFGQS